MGIEQKLGNLGVATTTLEQAVARSGGQPGAKGKDTAGRRVGNKGSECAEAALEMVDLMKKLPLRGND